MDITEEKVLQTIKGLKAKEAGGVDGLNSTFLIELADVITQLLTLIIRESLATGDIPEDWRTANVTPIFKNGSKKKAENYRQLV